MIARKSHAAFNTTNSTRNIQCSKLELSKGQMKLFVGSMVIEHNGVDRGLHSYGYSQCSVYTALKSTASTRGFPDGTATEGNLQGREYWLVWSSERWVPISLITHEMPRMNDTFPVLNRKFWINSLVNKLNYLLTILNK